MCKATDNIPDMNPLARAQAVLHPLVLAVILNGDHVRGLNEDANELISVPFFIKWLTEPVKLTSAGCFSQTIHGHPWCPVNDYR